MYSSRIITLDYIRIKKASTVYKLQFTFSLNKYFVIAALLTKKNLNKIEKCIKLLLTFCFQF